MPEDKAKKKQSKRYESKLKRENAIAEYQGGAHNAITFKPEYNETVEQLCKLGTTDGDVCLFFDISMTTLKRWKKRHPEFFMAMLRGKQVADTRVAAALYNSALGYDYYEDVAVKLKEEIRNDQGKIIKTKEFVEVRQLKRHAKGDVTAQIFYLKNRRPDLWRDVEAKRNGPLPEENKVVVGEQALIELKKEGFVMLDGEYEIVVDEEE